MYTLGQVLAVAIISFIGEIVVFMTTLVCIVEIYTLKGKPDEPDKEDWKGLL